MPKDWNGQEIKVGDEVTFGETAKKGKVIGFAEDGKVQVEVIEYQYGQTGVKPWRYVFVFPPGQAHIIKKEKVVPKNEEKEVAKTASSVM